MDCKLYFLYLCIIPCSYSFEKIHWNLLIFVGKAVDPSMFEAQRLLPPPKPFTVPQILYFLNESELNIVTALKRPFYAKSGNQIVSQIVLAELDSIPKASDNLLRILIPKKNPIVYKDEEKVALHVINWTRHDITNVFKSFGKHFKFKLLFSYSLHNEFRSPLIFTYCEFCKSKGDAFASKAEWTDYERNFEGTALNITTPFACTSRLNYSLGPDGKNYQMVSGLLKFFVQYMQKKLNFTINLKVAGRGGGTGAKLPNNSWNGIMAEVLNGEVDIGMCTAETYSRSQDAGFTPAVVVEPVVFVSGPPHKIFAWKAIFWPFRSEVWALIAGIIFISVVMIKYSYAILKIPREKRWATSKAFGFILEILLDNSGKIPKYLPLSIRAHVMIWVLCGLIITTAYLSKLVGFLTFPQYEKIPETAEELVESKYSWGLTYFGGALYTLIKGSKLKVYEKLLNRADLRTDTVGCLADTLEKKYICISYEIITQFYMKGRTELKQNPFTYPKSPFITIPVGIAMKKRAIFGPNMKEIVRSSHFAGFQSFWEEHDVRTVRKSILNKQNKDHENKMDKEEQENNDEATEDSRSLTMQHLRGAFAVFIGGLAFGLVAFILEQIVRVKLQCNPA